MEMIISQAHLVKKMMKNNNMFEHLMYSLTGKCFEQI